MVLLRAVALYEESKNKVQFCIKNGIRHKAMVEIHKMRLQLHRESKYYILELNNYECKLTCSTSLEYISIFIYVIIILFFHSEQEFYRFVSAFKSKTWAIKWGADWESTENSSSWFYRSCCKVYCIIIIIQYIT